MLACRRRCADDISDSTPSCSSPSLSTCDTEEGGESSEDSESTSPIRTFRVKLQKQDLKRVQRDQKKVGGSQGDAMQIDSAIGFENVGGLSEHITALKEMVIFPLLYPEVFQRFNIQPPRGCLFHGPPGTGKTLVARALASEYSRCDRKISFFMRNASDCMRKYVGESERQLRVLFEQAYQMRPSIIFFDEIDGLAPVRSSKQDHIYRSAFCEPTSCRPRLLIVGKEGYSQVSYVAPVVLHALEKFPVHTLDLSVLLTNVAPPEEICGQLIRNAQKTAPSIIYVPDIHLWWDNAGPALKLTFLTLLRNIPAFLPVLLLATSDVCHLDLPEEIQKLFNKEFGEVFNLELPGRAERAALFEDLILNQVAKPPVKKRVHRTLEVVPVAPAAEPQKPQEEEVGMLEEEEEDTLRELRIFLRDVTHRLATDRRFREFAKPVDPQKVPDYATRIKEPMDLSTVLTKIDSRQYLTAGDYLKDIDLICNNALEYYRDQRSTDRHRAYVLQDTAYSMVRNEMETEFGRLCEQIKESREKRGRTSPACAPCNNSKSPQQNPAPEDDKPDEESNENEEMT
uniref:ATPase family AAA domain containing 2 n=1 Tax=Anas platyrhynchos platyrhynchos TaxID=8840 RepID=A0A493TQN1_ANAPP